MSGKSKRWRWPLIALLLVAAAGGYAYWRFLHHAPTAHRHLPPDAKAAVRADGLELLRFPPVRQHIVPALVERWLRKRQGGEATPAERGGTEDLLERLGRETGAHLPADVREVVVGVVGPLDWVVAIGGKFPRGRFVAGLHKLLEEQGTGGLRRDGELLVHELGAAVAQAADGTLLFGTRAELVRAALPERDGAELVPVPVAGALSFVVSSAAWQPVTSLAGPLLENALVPFGLVARARGELTLSDSPAVHVELTPKNGDAEELARELDTLLSRARFLVLVAPGGELGGAKQALRDATVEPKGALVHLRAPWPYRPLEDAVRAVADGLRASGAGRR
jgi:hypothetical protein